MDPLTGRLLIAVPRTRGDRLPEVTAGEEGRLEISPIVEVAEDNVFERSVVLVLHHDEEGAHGLILNRPLPAEVDAVLPGWQQHVTAPDSIFQGGPVALDTALGLVALPGDDETIGIRRLFGDVALVDLDAPPAVVMPEVGALRIFAGYAGWSPGQLEDEITVGAWFVVDAHTDDLFTTEPHDLWTDVLRRQRSDVAFVASFPDEPALN